MNHWLLKTEPDCYSWSDMERDGKTFWDGIHNFQARNHLRAMKAGDLALFYHTGGEREIVGMVKIVKEAYPDASDPQWSWVDVEKVKAAKQVVGLDDLKTYPQLKDMKLFKQGRLSVVPLTDLEWEFVEKLAF